MGAFRKFIFYFLIISITIILVSCGLKNKEVETFNNETDKIDYTSEEKEKIAFLTFDDGPSKNTEKILEILKEENVKATFFVNGRETDFAKKMYTRMIEEGHTIGNHTYSHEYKKIYKSEENFMTDVEKLNRHIYDITGYNTDIFRFPGGSNNIINRKYSNSSKNEFMERLSKKVTNSGYSYIDWTVDSKDATKSTEKVEVIVSSTLSEALSQKYPVILFHDAPAKTTTVEALKTIIKSLKSNGYKIESLSKDSPVKPQFLKIKKEEILK